VKRGGIRKKEGEKGGKKIPYWVLEPRQGKTPPWKGSGGKKKGEKKEGGGRSRREGEGGGPRQYGKQYKVASGLTVQRGKSERRGRPKRKADGWPTTQRRHTVKPQGQKTSTKKSWGSSLTLKSSRDGRLRGQQQTSAWGFNKQSAKTLEWVQGGEENQKKGGSTRGVKGN